MTRRSELIETALRVLSSFSNGQQPRPEDVDELKLRAKANEATLPLDELACAIIMRQMHVASRMTLRRIYRAS